jgi:hypothetical protein
VVPGAAGSCGGCRRLPRCWRSPVGVALSRNPESPTQSPSGPVMDHVPRCPDRPRVLDFARGVSAVMRPLSAAINRICAATLLWTIVVLRDGRRCRSWRADVAQLVAHHLAKVRVAGSNPVIRSRCSRINPQRWSGRVVRQRPAKPCTRVRFPSPPPRWTRAISSAGERFPDTEEVTGSIPVSRTML